MFIEPVFGKKFFGREEILGTLHKRVTSLKGGYRQNMALSGPMLAGKSSILRHFLNNIDDPSIIPLYIEMDDADFPLFSMRFMSTILYRYLKSEDQKAEGDFDALKKMCRQKMPETVSCIDKICKALKQRKENVAYEKLLELTSVFKKETGKSCIVILDEFHNLSNFHLKKPFQVFGKFIMVQKNTMYIVSSSQKTLLKEILSKKLSLLFGNFEMIEVNGFDSRTARSFISDKISGRESFDVIRSYLIQLSQGNPFYLEVLSNKFVEVMDADNKLDSKEALLEAFSALLYESDGVLNQYFTNNINFFLERKSRKKFIPVLISLSRGNSMIKDIQKDIGRVDKDLSSKLQKLQEMDLVFSSGVFYKIADKLFEYWIRCVYSVKTRSMIDDMDIKYLEFKHSMDQDFSDFCEANSRSLMDVITDLFKSFRNEKVLISMNYKKLPFFDNVKKCTVSDNIFEVQGKIKDKIWMCRVKQHDMVYEQDICDLWETDAGSQGSRIARRIFIAVNGIEQNAFLLAKERNIWVWNVKQLNRILRLYGKFELAL